MWLKNPYHNLYQSVLFILILFNAIKINAQPPLKFHCRYGGSGYDVGYDVKQTLDKGYIITGSTSSFGQGNTDVYLLKLDSMGQVKFQTSFGGFSNDIGKSIIALADSGFIMVGYTSSTGIGGYDIFLVKADKNGALEWQKTIGGADWDFAHSMQQTADGGFIIAGTTYSFGHGNADGYIVKTDANGNVQWSKTYGGKKDDEFKSVIQTIDGNFALTGYTKSYADSLSDIWVFKVDTNGDSLWCKFYGGNRQDYGNDIAQNNLGDYFIAGARDSLSAGKLDAYALRISSSGAFGWHFLDGNPGTNESYNSVLASQTTQGFSIYPETETFSGFGIHIKIFEMNSGGYWNNATEYGDVLADEIYKISPTTNKGYVGVGYTNNYGAQLTDVYVLTFDSNLVGSNSIVSVSEISKYKITLSVYPNPASKEIKIKTSIKINTDDLKLYDIIGNEVFLNDKIIFSESDLIILNTEELKRGVYFLKIYDTIEKVSIIH